MQRLVLTAAVLILSVTLTHSQFKPESGNLIINFGFTEATPDDVSGDLSGNSFMVTYEKSNREGNLSGGVVLGYSTTSADSLNATGQELALINSVSFNVVPIMCQGKVNFGPERIRGYIGLGVGVHFSQVTYYSNNVQTSGRDSGFLLGGLLGFNVFLNEALLLNANYSSIYMGNSYYRDGVAHSVSFGLGFQFD